MFKILLVNPPISVYAPKAAIIPLPSLTLGGILRDLRTKGLEITFELVDLDLLLKLGQLEDAVEFYDKAVTLIFEKNPDACFFSTHGANMPITIQLCQKIKERTSNILTVLGGVAPTLSGRQLIEHFDAIDMIIKGEAEPSLPEWVKQALGNRLFHKVPSAVLRYKGAIIDNPRLRLKDGNGFVFPDYSLIDMEVYRKHNERCPFIFPGLALVESGRGCNFNCTFCAPAKMWESRVLYKPIDKIIEEMSFLKDRGFDFTYFTQDNLDAEFMRQLASELVRRQVHFRWGAYARINQMDDELVDLLARSGCKLLFVGLETPNRGQQKYVRKFLDKSQMLQRIRALNAKGIRLICSFIAAFEGETEEEFENTLEFAVECAVSEEFPTLKKKLGAKTFESLPEKPINYSTVHPLSDMPGTDFDEEVKGRLRLVAYTNHHDAYGSTLFGLDTFTGQNWKYVLNTFVTHLTEEQVSFYYPRLRLFNILCVHAFHLAYFLTTQEISILQFLHRLIAHIGEEAILTTNVQEFEKILSDAISRMMGSQLAPDAARKLSKPMLRNLG